MKKEFWLQKWRAGQIGFHRDDVHPLLVKHWPALNLVHAARVLVPLCGKSNDMVWLRDQGHQVVGVEISREAVEAFFSEHKTAPDITTAGDHLCFSSDGITIYLGDFFSWRPDAFAPIDAVYDRASLIALPSELRTSYARHLASLVPGGAQSLLITLAYDEQQMSGPPFSVPEREVSRLFDKHFSRTTLWQKDILDAEPNFRERGLSSLIETVYQLKRLA